jgi:rhodanese-related sulfurtransferase
MGNTQTLQKVSFEDMKQAIQHPDKYFIINTLKSGEQDCLIPTTIPFLEEERRINEWLQNKQSSRPIIVYGRNNNDDTIIKRYHQLSNLGFSNVYLYSGGMFEWLLLQDIYGVDNFPTTRKQLDILAFRPPCSLSQKPMIAYGDID